MLYGKVPSCPSRTLTTFKQRSRATSTADVNVGCNQHEMGLRFSLHPVRPEAILTNPTVTMARLMGSITAGTAHLSHFESGWG